MFQCWDINPKPKVVIMVLMFVDICYVKHTMGPTFNAAGPSIM